MTKAKYKYPYKAKKNNIVITEELTTKHKLSLTLAPIDVCLRKGLISKAMHKAANYFIYLYSIRFGCHHLKSQTSNVYSYDNWQNRQPDKDFEEKQNALYKDLVLILTNLRCYELILDICVYEKFPGFLKQIPTAISDAEYRKFKRALEKISIIFMNLS